MHTLKGENIKFQQYEQIVIKYHNLTPVYQKLWLYDVWLQSYGSYKQSSYVRPSNVPIFALLLHETPDFNISVPKTMLGHRYIAWGK